MRAPIGPTERRVLSHLHLARRDSYLCDMCPVTGGVWAWDNPMKLSNLHCKQEKDEEVEGEEDGDYIYANTKESKRRLFLALCLSFLLVKP